MIYSKYDFLSYLSYIISVYYHHLSSNLNETISHHEGLRFIDPFSAEKRLCRHELKAARGCQKCVPHGIRKP